MRYPSSIDYINANFEDTIGNLRWADFIRVVYHFGLYVVASVWTKVKYTYGPTCFFLLYFFRYSYF